jgi:hypothetical protein
MEGSKPIAAHNRLARTAGSRVSLSLSYSSSERVVTVICGRSSSSCIF